MGLMLGEFTERLYDIVDQILPVRAIVCKALEEAELVHPSKQIIVVEKSCPFMDYLIEIEKERGIEQFHSSKYSSLYFINCYLN